MKAQQRIGKWRILSYFAAGLLALLPFWTFVSVWLGSQFGHLDFWKLLLDISAFGLALPVLWLAWQNPKSRQWLKTSKVVRLYGVYILLFGILSIWGLHTHAVNRSALIDGSITDLRFIGFFVICFLLAANHSFLVRNWVKLTLWPAAGVVLFGLAERFILPINFLSHFGYSKSTVPAYQTVNANASYPRLQSTLRGPNPLGAYLGLILPAWLTVWWRRWLAVFVGLALGFGVLVYSYSRSAEAATLIALGLLIWRQLPKWRSQILAAAVVLAVLGSGFLYVERNSSLVQENLFHTSSHSTSAKSSGAVRASALRHGLSDTIHHPFGRGPGTAGPASTHNQPHPARIAENYFVQIAQEVGWLGLAIFIAINVAVVQNLWRLRAGVLPQILLASFVGLTLIDLVSHAWADETLAMLWWGLAGVALGAHYPAAERSPAR